MYSRLLSIFFLSLSLSVAAQGLYVVRAAIDIGMGGPKLQVAEIDLKTNKITRVLHTQRYFVNFYDSLSGDNLLKPEIRILGLEAVKEAVNKANTFGAEGIVAIATAAFRTAVNGRQFADEIQKETGIPVHIVDQNLEGKLAFEAARSRLDRDAEHLVAWDIGGGSIQFISTTPEGIHTITGQDKGVGAFKDYIIETIQQRDIESVHSPNPMSAEDLAQAAHYARQLAGEIGKDLKDKIGHSTTTVIGVGSVFAYGIKGMLGGKNPFTIEDLEAVVHSLPGKTDADLGGGDYAFVEGSNTAFVLGFMQNLNIKQLHIVDVNNADGALLYEPFW